MNMIISFEGLDGCGKSTQITKLLNTFKQSGRKAEVLREPGSNRISEMIREILLDRKNLEMSDGTELLLYLASRYQLVSGEIRTLYEKGTDIILDRFMDSTTAYQGYGRGIDIELIEKLNRFVTLEGRFYPEVTFFIDISPEEAFSRMSARGEILNRMETAGKEFFTRVRNGFLEICGKSGGRMVRIDGTGSIDDVHGKIIDELIEREMI